MVTGAGGAIGRALSLALAAEGMVLAVTDIDGDRLRETQALVEGAGAACLAVEADLTDRSGAAALGMAVRERFGAVNLLSNNAGVLRHGTSWEQPPEMWQRVLAVNLHGAVNVVHEFLPEMIASGNPGHVLNTVGQVALFSPAFAPPASYTASKHALLAYTEVLHLELRAIGSLIGVTALCPSGVRSDIVPPDGPASTGPTLEMERAALARLQRSIATGATAQDVAAQAVAAVKGGRFWAFPDDGYRARLEHRSAYIASQNDPAPLPPTARDRRQDPPREDPAP